MSEQYFGAKWMDHAGTQVPTPVGEPCQRCQEPIAEGDQGYIHAVLSDKHVERRPIHRACFLRGIFGSVGHQKGECSCFGGTTEDPPGMTVREAAEAAMRLALAPGRSSWIGRVRLDEDESAATGSERK